MDSTDFIVFRRGVVYEGDADQLWAVYPRPLVVEARWPPLECLAGHYQDRVFLEDSFDTLTRIRRGRFYWMAKGETAQRWNPMWVANGPYGQHVGIPPHMNKFNYERICEIASVPDVELARKEIVCLGSGKNTTHWKVTDVEMNVFGHQVFTLRARSLFGVLPKINEMDTVKDKDGNLLEDSAIKEVRSSLATLVDTYHRFQSVQTVDAAREAARIILAKWIGQKANGKDLGDLIDNIRSERSVLSKAAFIVNRLHPRGKTSEQENQSMKGNPIREPTEDDARTSLELVGMILREIGWDEKQ